MDQEEFIKKANKLYSEYFNYCKVNYIDIFTEVEIICPRHGSFFQKPTYHLQNRSCEECSMELKIIENTKKFVEKSRKVHNNFYNYSKTIFYPGAKKVEIICPIHGEFWQRPNDHYRCGCAECGKNKSANSRKRSQEEIISKFKKVHGNTKYIYDKVNYINLGEKIEIFCSKHKKYFWQSAGSHLLGTGCPSCGVDIVKEKLSSNTDEFIKKAKIIHNNLYDYSKVEYKLNRDEVIIICNKHKIEFMQTPFGHLRGNGCQVCAKEKAAEKRRKDHKNFMLEIYQIHGDKYNYLNEYTTAHAYLNIECLKHGVFKMKAYSHLQGQGCLKCANIASGLKRRSTIKDVIEESNKIHGKDRYDFTEAIYNGTDKKIIIICHKHGFPRKFKQTPHSHLGGAGCPECYKIISKKEENWLNSLNIKNLEKQFFLKVIDDSGKKRKFWADGYDPDTNTIYEFHGDFWHGNPKTCDQNKSFMGTETTFGDRYRYTINKENLIKKAGYNLIVMWEFDWDKQQKTNNFALNYE